MRKLTTAVLAATFLAAPAAAQTWTGPDPKRVPNLLNPADVDYALSEVCFPYLTGADPAALEKRAGVVKHRRHEAWKRGAQAYFVGSGSQTTVLEGGPDGRRCTVWARAGDPQKQKNAVLERLATWPTPLASAAFQYPPNNYAERLFLCGPSGGPHDTALISVGGRRGQRTDSLVVTVTRSPARSARCDGVAPSAETLSMNAPVAVETLGRLARACRDTVTGRPSAAAFAEIDPPSGPLRLNHPALGSMAGPLRAFFGDDAEVAIVRAPGTTGFAFVSLDGAKCRVALKAGVRFDAAVRKEIDGWDGWRTTGPGAASGPDGASLAWRVEPASPPVETVILELRRGR